MEKVIAYLGLGSNLGRREEHLGAAIQRLSENPVSPIKVLRSSSVYETPPWGLKDQPDFLNCVLEVETTLPPAGLLKRAKAVEAILGRQPELRFGPRIIDVDILLFGSLVLEQPNLQIPHSRLHLRAFALIPLAELEPGLIHPVLNLPVGQLAKGVDGQEGVTIWGPPPVVLNSVVNSRRITQ